MDRLEELTKWTEWECEGLSALMWWMGRCIVTQTRTHLTQGARRDAVHIAVLEAISRWAETSAFDFSEPPHPEVTEALNEVAHAAQRACKVLSEAAKAEPTDPLC